MTTPTPSPNYRTGKICYIEIPAIDISQSAQFYQEAFGWHIRQRNDGSTAFDDATGEVSGTWIPGRPPSTDPGLLVFIMVASIATTIEAIIAAGGETGGDRARLWPIWQAGKSWQACVFPGLLPGCHLLSLQTKHSKQS